MSPFIIKALQLLLSLSLLIVLHEFGHYIPAKIFKTRVEKFFLFFDVKFALFKKKIGETVYGIGWLPLGGYVKISGMIDESMDKEQMAKPPEPWEFRSKPAWQRLIIMIGGVTVNIVLGYLIYAMVLFVWGSNYIAKEDLTEGFMVSESIEKYGFQDGDKIVSVNGKEFENQLDINKHFMVRDVKTVSVEHQNGENQTLSIPEDIGEQLFKQGDMFPFTPKIKPIIDSVESGFPAEKAGILPGDKVLAINGEKIENWSSFNAQKDSLQTKNISLTIERDGNTMEVSVRLNEDNRLGIRYNRYGGIKVSSKTYSFGESLSYGFDFAYWTLHDYVAQFKYVFTKKGATQVGGFGAIGSLFPDMWDWQQFWLTTAFISIILAFMNILPIPALDGGHVMFLLYEMVTGRKPNDKFMEYAQMIGFFILIALVLFANGNDVYRWLFE